VLKFGIDYSTFTMSRSTFMCEAALNAYSDAPTETWTVHSSLVENLQRTYELRCSDLFRIYSTSASSYVHSEGRLPLCLWQPEPSAGDCWLRFECRWTRLQLRPDLLRACRGRSRRSLSTPPSSWVATTSCYMHAADHVHSLRYH